VRRGLGVLDLKTTQSSTSVSRLSAQRQRVKPVGNAVERLRSITSAADAHQTHMRANGRTICLPVGWNQLPTQGFSHTRPGLTRLAFLAPRIVEAIATGLQPPHLTAKSLTERIELPLL